MYCGLLLQYPVTQHEMPDVYIVGYFSSIQYRNVKYQILRTALILTALMACIMRIGKDWTLSLKDAGDGMLSSQELMPTKEQ